MSDSEMQAAGFSHSSSLSDRQIAESLPQLVWTCEANGECDYLSRQWVEYTGIPEEAQLKFGWLNQVHPDDRAMVVVCWNETAGKGENFDVEFRIRRHDSVYRWFKTRAVPLRDSSGKIVRWFGSNTDIEDLKQAEISVRESEELFRVTFEQAAVGIAHVGLDGRFLRVNQKLCSILGYSREELMERTFDAITWPDDTSLHQPQMDDLISGRTQNLNFEKRYRHENGNAVWVHVTSALRRFADSSPRYFISIIEDISARKRAEEALRLLSNIGETLVATLDAKSTAEALLNLLVPSWADWATIKFIEDSEAGMVLREVVTRHVNPEKQKIASRLLHDYTFSPVAGARFSAILKQGKPVLIPETNPDFFIAPSADPTFVSLVRAMNLRSNIMLPLHSRILRDEQGQPRLIGTLSCAITESERRYDEQDLALFQEIGGRVRGAVDRANLFAEAEKARRTAEEANRAKDEFLSVVSHELRTPLTPIMGWVGLLRTPMDENTRHEALDVIERNLNAQVRIVSDILDSSRITSGKLNLEKKILPLTPLVRESLDAIREQAKDKNVALFVSLPLDDFPVFGDGLRLRQVIWNLLTNAIKFTPDGGRVELQMRLAQPAEIDAAPQVEIIVRDTGIGIKSEFLPHIFEPFRQADSSQTRQHGGLGLGLSIVQHLVEKHDGTVEAHSDGDERGSTFIVRLPLAEK